MSTTQKARARKTTGPGKIRLFVHNFSGSGFPLAIIPGRKRGGTGFAISPGGAGKTKKSDSRQEPDGSPESGDIVNVAAEENIDNETEEKATMSQEETQCLSHEEEHTGAESSPDSGSFDAPEETEIEAAYEIDAENIPELIIHPWEYISEDVIQLRSMLDMGRLSFDKELRDKTREDITDILQEVADDIFARDEERQKYPGREPYIPCERVDIFIENDTARFKVSSRFPEEMDHQDFEHFSEQYEFDLKAKYAIQMIAEICTEIDVNWLVLLNSED